MKKKPFLEKPQHIVPDVSTYGDSLIQLAITYNPKLDNLDRRSYAHGVGLNGDFRVQHRTLVENLFTIPFRSAQTIVLVTEVSKHGKVHGHGLLKIHDLGTFISSTIPYLMRTGTIAIKHLSPWDAEEQDDDGVGWFGYCSKEQHLWKPLCVENKVPYIISSNDICSDSFCRKYNFDKWSPPMKKKPGTEFCMNIEDDEYPE